MIQKLENRIGKPANVGLAESGFSDAIRLLSEAIVCLDRYQAPPEFAAGISHCLDLLRTFELETSKSTANTDDI